MKDTVNRTIGVIDSSAVVIACSELGRIGEVQQDISQEIIFSSEMFIRNGLTFQPFGAGAQKAEYAVFVEGNDDLASKYANIIAISLTNIKQYYDEKNDKGNFIKNVIMDNILSGDIYLKSRELNFNTDVLRVVFLIRTVSKNDYSAFDAIQNLFPDKSKDFVINIGNNDIVLVKETSEETSIKDFENLAHSIADTLSSEFYIDSVIGIGTEVKGIKDLARSYKEAQVSLEVGKVFDTGKSIISYEHLGIARLIYQLPTTLCDMFLREVFKKGSIESLDQETLFTIHKFFENNLNVSETSRKLFVHRNTLVYRLEKIKKYTGLDLREFDDAIVFKVALMVNKYLTTNPIKY
jgi:carbohydrate diacid regulator